MKRQRENEREKVMKMSEEEQVQRKKVKSKCLFFVRENISSHQAVFTLERFPCFKFIFTCFKQLNI